MSEPKVIARLLCGSCDPKNRHVIGKLVDTPSGAALRSNLRRAGYDPTVFASPPTIRERYDDVPVAEMGDPWSNTHALTLGCPKHARGVFTPAYFAELEAEYRRTGRPVNRVVNISPPVPE